MFNENAITIKNRMLDNMSADVDKSEGSFANDSIAASSEEFSRQSNNLDEIIQRVFAKTAFENGYSDDLERKCEEFGVFRKSGTPARGFVTFYGANDTNITKGTLVQTDSNLIFKTTSNGTITDGAATIEVEAIDIGSKYNVPPGQISNLVLSLVGIVSAKNNLSTSNGTDIESDQNLYQRLLTKVSTPSTSGNKFDYLNWALEVEGVGGARVFPLWAGNNTIKIILLDANKQPVTNQLEQDVFNNIEEKRPIGAQVTVESAIGVIINLSVDVIKSDLYSLEQIENNIVNKLQSYIKNAAFNDSYISYAIIGANILSAEGVLDHSSLLINGSATNIGLNSNEVALLGEVIVNVT